MPPARLPASPPHAARLRYPAFSHLNTYLHMLVTLPRNSPYSSLLIWTPFPPLKPASVAQALGRRSCPGASQGLRTRSTLWTCSALTAYLTITSFAPLFYGHHVKAKAKLAKSISSSRSSAPTPYKGTGRNCTLEPCYRFRVEAGDALALEGEGNMESPRWVMGRCQDALSTVPWHAPLWWGSAMQCFSWEDGDKPRRLSATSISVCWKRWRHLWGIQLREGEGEMLVSERHPPVALCCPRNAVVLRVGERTEGNQTF